MVRSVLCCEGSCVKTHKGDREDAGAAEGTHDLGEDVRDALQEVALAGDDQAESDRGVDVATRVVTEGVGQRSDGKAESERHL